MDFRRALPSIATTVVGFGQAGSRIADKFAGFKTADGKTVYVTHALNSNDGDLAELKYIPLENRVSLKLGGMGKDPEKGLRVLEENENARAILRDFIRNKVKPTDELTLFIAGLGGGSGTSTIIKAIEEFHDHHNNSLLKAKLLEIKENVGHEEFSRNVRKYQVEAFQQVRQKYKKVGVIVTIPTRSDGPDVLRQVSSFASKIWEITKNKTKGIAFTIFADNQMFYDRFQSISSDGRYNNYRDFANAELSSIFHEINVGSNIGGTSVTIDSNDFRRVIMEHNGCLILNRVEQNAKTVTNATELKQLFLSSLESNNFHDPIRLEEETENEETKSYAKVFHVGLLAIIPPELNHIGSSFIDDAKEEISSRLPLQGTIFSGFLNEHNQYNATIYTFYKAEALPTRLSIGLVEEYEEFMKKQQKIRFKTEGISQIAVAAEEFDFDDIDMLSEMGIEIKDSDITDSSDTPEVDEDFDFSDITPEDL
ncbi:cell division protein FtsZ [Cohnella phaseoli]|uniref:Tubulin/FtsZ family with GTPase domain n=1 Tax=Cohnella phaseoli TaxID=456490 RepID=A0A3D9JPR6_9BACL|nr:cell division protein FtsZ [Cohnella phaseoli]RED76101.1 hypothetical protein DFP98_113162 [Cohnella phaseoli]